MAFFEYTASDNTGNIKSGEMEAVDRETLIDFLKSEDLLVISVKTKSSGISRKVSAFSGKISPLDKISFAENLSTMLKAGVNLNAALDVISADVKNTRFKTLLGDLKFAIQNGKPLSEALANYPNDFDQVFINMIKAGEASGKLEEALSRLNVQLKKDYSLTTKVKSALIYPAVLISGVLGVLVLIITFVIPRLVTIFSGSSLKIPLTTKMLFALAKVASYKPALTIGVLISLVILAVILVRTKAVKTLLNRILFRLPIANTLLKQIELTRFARTAGGLLGSGVPIGEALDITASGMSLPIYKKIILDAKGKILKGVSLTNAFKGAEKYFPSLLLSVINVGEKTAELDRLLMNLADFYEEQADNTLKTMTNLIEPVLLVIVGLLIGGMAISIVVPIYQLIGTI